MRIEAVRGRVGGMLGNELQILSELGYAAGMAAVGAAHHRHQKASVGKRIELVGNGGLRRVGCREEFRSRRVRHVEEKDLLLSLQNTQQPAASEHVPVAGKPD